MSKKKKKSKRAVSEPEEQTIDTETSVSEAPETEGAVQPPAPKSLERSRTIDFSGPRNLPPMMDGEISFERLGFVVAKSSHADCQDVYTEKGTKLGTLSRLPLKKIWSIAERRTGGRTASKYGITEEEWNDVSDRLSKYASIHQLQTVRRFPMLLQDVWKIHEIDFEEMFLFKAKNAAKLMMEAAKADMEESAQVAARWKRIKRYPHKVELSEKSGGIFNDHDVKVLVAYGITKLNDIRKKDVYYLKNLFLEHDYSRLPEEINAAFKEDLERRKDFRYQFWPVFFGICSSLVTSIIGFIFQYTLLKNDVMTLTIFALLGLWLITIALMVRGALRARRRRRTKRPYYKYLSGPMKIAFSGFVLVSVMSITATTVFYERYDGYDSVYFYRNLGNNEITIADLFDKDAESLRIPDSIDEKTVKEICPSAFRGSKAVRATVPDSVEKLGSSVFKNCKSLTSVEIPDSVTELPSGLFEGCSSLRYFEISSSVTSIGNSAFSGSGIGTMIVPETVTTVGKNAFKKCLALTAIRFLGSPESIGNNAFDGCSSLALADFEGTPSLTEISPYLFADCRSLQETNFFESAKIVGKGALQNCASLTSFTLPVAETLGKGIFNGCASLETLTVPFIGKTKESAGKCSYLFDKTTPVRRLIVTDAVRIADNAFAGSDRLLSVRLPETVEEIGKGAFKGCTNLTDIVLPSGIEEIRANTFEGCEALTDLTFPAGVVSIGDSAFAKSGLWEITLPESLVEVGANAFKDCGELSVVKFQGAPSTVGKSAFEGCASLASIRCADPSSLKRIEPYTFKQCTSLTETNLFQNAEYVGKSALEGCKGLLQLSLPSAVELGKNIFKGCTSLTSLSVPFLGKNRSSAETYSYLFDTQTPIRTIEITDAMQIGKNAFAGLDKLQRVVLADSVETIGKSAFRECINLTSVQLPEGLKRVEDETFYGCRVLETIGGASTLEFVGKSAFERCSILQPPAFMSTVTTIGKQAFYGCSAFASLSLDKAKEIGESAFSSCYALSSVTFSSSLEKVGYSAFASTALVVVDLSSLSGVTLGSYVFSNCDNLTTVRLPSDADTVPEGFAESCSNLTHFTIDPQVTTIGASAFYNSGIESLEIPETLHVIEKMAFAGCKLTNVSVPSSIEKIGKSAFACTSLKEFSGPFLGESRKKTSNGYSHLFGDNGQVTRITVTEMQTVKGSVFGGGSRTLQSVSLPKTTVITSGVFKNFTRLTSVTFGSELATIGKNVFEGCASLAQIDFPASLEKIESGAFRNCTALSDPALPSSLKEIGNEAFKGCTKIKSFVVPDSVEKLGKNIFVNCSSLTELTLPFIGKARDSSKALNYLIGSNSYLDTITVTDAYSLAKRTFDGFEFLREITLKGNIVTVGEEIFRGCTRLSVLSIPSYLEGLLGEIPTGVRVQYIDR